MSDKSPIDIDGTAKSTDYSFNIIPKEVKKINTKYRKIITKIPSESTVKTLELLRKHEPHSMNVELPIVWENAEGFQIFDGGGNCWIDFSSGTFVANVGHANENVCKAINGMVEQKLLHNYYFPSAIRAKLVKKLSEMIPSYLNKIFLLTTGAESTETTIKLARIFGRKKDPKKIGIISFVGSMQGKTLGALMVGGKTKEKHWIVNLDPDMHHLPFPDSDSGAEFFHESMKNLELSGVDLKSIAAFMVESFQGWGALFYPKEYIQELRKWANENDVIVIFDEVQAGFGRTGKLFAFEHYDVEPDLVCCGKGISSSLPLSAVLGKKELIDVEPSLNSTHGGNPICCAATLASLQVLESENLIQESYRKGKILENTLTKIKAKYPKMIDIHGKGLLFAIHIKNTNSNQRDPLLTDKILERCMEKGVMMLRTGLGTLKIGPPLIIPDDALIEGILTISEAIDECINENNGNKEI